MYSSVLASCKAHSTSDHKLPRQSRLLIPQINLGAWPSTLLSVSAPGTFSIQKNTSQSHSWTSASVCIHESLIWPLNKDLTVEYFPFTHIARDHRGQMSKIATSRNQRSTCSVQILLKIHYGIACKFICSHACKRIYSSVFSESENTQHPPTNTKAVPTFDYKITGCVAHAHQNRLILYRL